MKPTELLVQEHAAIKQMLKIIDKMCDILQKGERVDPLHLEQSLEFIRNFADKCHHGKEEDILFKTMVESGFPGESGPIAVMLSEHDTGRDLVKKFSDALERYKNGEENATAIIIENAQKYSSLLDYHINKENNILYPMADKHLTREQQNKMSEEFDKFEQQKMGPGKHEEYHSILENLAAVYLN